MRRKNRKWAALAVGLYLLLVWWAYRWGISQIPDDGPLLARIEREEVRKFNETRAREKEEQAKALWLPTAQTRLAAAGPVYVAVRYDQSHIVFIVSNEAASRFSPNGPLRFLTQTPARIPAPSHPAAPLAGLQELWQADSRALHFFPGIMQQTQPGEQWTLSLGPGSTVPVAIERPILAPNGCSLDLGFLASLPPDQRSAFAPDSQEYFAVRRTPVESADPPAESQVAELANWRASPTLRQQIVRQLNERMKQEAATIDARLLDNAGSPRATEMSIGNAYSHLREWLRTDRALTGGEGTLTYDLRAFRVTPDASPRLYVRARWSLSGSPAFLMTAWFKVDTHELEPHKLDAPKTEAERKTEEKTEPLRASQKTAPNIAATLLWADSSWSLAMRQGEAPAGLGERLDFQTILNQFDADQDGWAELLIHSYDVNSDRASRTGPSTTLAVYLYTDVGLVPLKMSLRRDQHTPESCLDQQ